MHRNENRWRHETLAINLNAKTVNFFWRPKTIDVAFAIVGVFSFAEDV